MSSRLTAEDDLRDAPFLILANKQDLANAASVEMLIEKLDLRRLPMHIKWSK